MQDESNNGDAPPPNLQNNVKATTNVNTNTNTDDVSYAKPTLTEYTDGVFLCFSIDQSIYNPDFFKINSSLSNLSQDVIRPSNNLIILRVYSSGLLSMALSYFSSKQNFRVSYKDNRGNIIFSCPDDFTLEKNKIKFIYDAAKKGSIKSKNFKNPSGLEQFKSFDNIIKDKECLFTQTLEHLSYNLDIDLFLHLFEAKEDKRKDLFKILDNFPYFKIIYQKNKPLLKVNFDSFAKNKNYNKLILIYSIIEDSTNLLSKFSEDDLELFFQYNEIQKDSPLLIKKNIFLFFMDKTKNIENIKKICIRCESIPLLFDYLLELNSEKKKEIKGLQIKDLPANISLEDKFLELIDKYEKIKEMFKENEINQLWKKYLSKWYKIKNIPELEEVKNKFSSIDHKGYEIIIDEINTEIVNRGKKLIHEKKLKGLDMYKFINKYNSIDNFFSDEKLLDSIGSNIDLKELDTDPNVLIEFNLCKFFAKIDSSKIVGYIAGILSKVNDFEQFYLLFKYIYELKEKSTQSEEKHHNMAFHIIGHFMYLVSNIQNIKTDIFKEIFQKVILLSLMYIKNTEKRNYSDLTNHLSNCYTISNDELFNLFIEQIINANNEQFITEGKKDEISKYVIKKFYGNLNIEKKIQFLLKIKSSKLKEYICEYCDEKQNRYFPKLQFEHLLSIEDTDSLNYLACFIKNNVFANEDIANITYFKELENQCESIRKKLDQKDITFSVVNQLNELIQKKKIQNRINCICLNNSEKYSQLENNLKTYIEKYIKYSKQLDNLIRYYNNYYPNSKKEEINKYSEQQLNFKEAKINISSIEINENINEEIKIFTQYENSQFFGIFYKNTNLRENNNAEMSEEEIKKYEVDKFNKTIETFNECKKLFNEQEFQLSFLDIPLTKLEDKDNNDNLLKEIIYLKKHFGYNDADEKKITEGLIFYKNRENISSALKSLKNMTEVFSVENAGKFYEELDILIEKIEQLTYFKETSEIIKKLKKIDENILEKNFLEILVIFSQNDELFNFLNSLKESETRDLIDGLFDNDNDENVTIELKDIETLINVVCFIQELKNKTKNINIFLIHFHSLLEHTNEIYREIVSNIAHIDNKLFELQEYIKIQLGKNYKYSANIEKFLQEGIISFKKEKQTINDIFALFIYKDTKTNKEEIFYKAKVNIGDKEEYFESFMETIKKIKSKNIYKYGKNRDNFLRAQKIAQLIQQILKELNLNINQEFNEVYKVANFQFIDKGVLKLPELEKVLDDLRRKNYKLRIENLRKLDSNPTLQFLFSLDLYDFEEINNKEKIESYFPNIHEIEENEKSKVVHRNYSCDGCGMKPLRGPRYHCKVCPNFDYCEECYKALKHEHNDFEKVEIPVEFEGLPPFLSLLFIITQIKFELNLKGLFFYKTTKSDYELDILKICNKIFWKFPDKGGKYIDSFSKNLPFSFNLLLCYDNLKENEIYAFCVRAINCKTNNLFIIVRPEELQIGKERYFFKHFNHLLEKKNYQLNSCIIVLYINQNSHIVKQLKKIKEKYDFPEEPPFFRNFEDAPIEDLTDFPIEIVTSDSPRVGKTTYIYNNVDKDEVILKIPLGDIDQFFLTMRTDSLNDYKGRKQTIILELYENQSEYTYNLIRNFLFQFLILKSYQTFNYISMKNVKIFIEVSSDYTNFDEDYKILKLFRRYNIQLKNNPNFYEKYKILPYSFGDFMDVLNYLKLLKNGEINYYKTSINTYSDILLGNIKSLDENYDLLIKEFFIKKFPSTKLLPNYGQIQIFANLLGDLIYNFECCSEMDPANLKLKVNQFPFLASIREKIIRSYIDFVIKFSSLTYESILENQKIASENQKNISKPLTVTEKKKLIEQLNKKRVITYNEIKPSIILFNNFPSNKEGYDELNKCTILTTYNEQAPEYSDLNRFYGEYLNQGALLNLLEFGAPQFIFELKNICLTPDYEKKYIHEQLANYEFTIDNFIKMVLIYLRIRAKIPLILMGETGCGKTSLIEALACFLKGKYKLIKFNIHSGLFYEEIIHFLQENNLTEKKNSLDEFKKLVKGIKPEEKKEEEKIILFLDEINTTNSLNLLCDIFTKHSFLGLLLKKNVYVIGACNPYRLMLSDNEEIGYMNKKKHNVRNLVYTVNPLPLCLINYVFDFGNLKDEDERKYIHKFVDSFLNNRFSKSNNENYTIILEIVCNAVYSCQKYVRESSEISSVSLREIKRFRIFFEFFLNITQRRNEFKENDFSFVKDDSIFKKAYNNKEKLEDVIILKAASLSLFMCYYIRIVNTKKRQELAKKIDDILKFDFLEYPLKLENDLVDNIILDKGIAKNRALLDNLFSIFVCLNNKIPVFICGKAGCSKTLSFSLLFQSMKGEYSKKELFKKYPSLYVTSYQGSLTSKSNEIKTIFERAKKIVNLEEKKKEQDKQKKLKARKRNGNISVILFDEMGLAEISPYNPLKVIHSELDGNQEVGFVGISNWMLDASKMNRGIHLSVQEPDLDDLILTANTIANGIYEEIENIKPFKKVIENLTKSYYKYKEHLKNLYALNYDFHGARDFYYLIKIASRLLKNNSKNQSIENIAMESIERNFGGLELDKEDNKIWPSTKKVKELFSKFQNNYIENIDKYDIFSCVKNNIEDENSRYLLLITRKTKNDTLIEFILKKFKKEYRFIQGSKLKEDQNEEYVLQKAWSIISSMENGEIIILKDMEIVYPKFYDLFNKNLQKYGNAQYARIVLDSTTNERHIVNKNFRCIILLEQNEVDDQDPPFLNRFEKHLISFRYLLTEKQNRIAKELFDEIKDLTTIPENKRFLPLLVNINLEEIRCLLLDLSTKVENIEDNIKEIYQLLIPTFTQENILNAVFSPQKKYIKKEDIINIYEENTHTNIFKFLENVKRNKLVVYTFTPYNKDIFTEQNNIEIKNEYFGTISKDNTVEITFNNKLSEKMLNYFFNLYYEKSNYNLFIIHFRVKDTKFLKYIKFQLDNFHKENKENPKKIFLFIIHIEKNYDLENNHNNEKDKNKSVEYLEQYHSYFLSFISEYQQITIDNILEQRNISVINLFNKTNEELLVIKELFDVNSIIKKEFSRRITQMATSQKMNLIIDKLDNLAKNGVLECIIKKIQNTIKNSDNILRKILINYSSLREKDFDFISYFVEKIELLLSDNVEKLIKELGKSGYLVSYLFEVEIPEKLRNPVFSFINNINLLKDKVDDDLESCTLDMIIPGSKLLIKKLTSLVKNCKIDYLNKEDEYRKGSKKKDNIKKKTLEDVHFEKKQYLKSRLWNEELLNDDIFSNYSQDILKDFFTLYFYDINKKQSLSEKQEEFLLFLYSKRNVNDSLLDRFLYFFLWIGSYNETILKLLEIFDKLEKYFTRIKKDEKAKEKKEAKEKNEEKEKIESQGKKEEKEKNEAKVISEKNETKGKDEINETKGKNEIIETKGKDEKVEDSVRSIKNEESVKKESNEAIVTKGEEEKIEESVKIIRSKIIEKKDEKKEEKKEGKETTETNDGNEINDDDNDKMALKHSEQTLLDGIRETYDKFKLPSEKEKEREMEKEKVNGIFYRICESICYIITNINNIDFNLIDLNQFCTDLNEIAQIMTQLNTTLSLGLKGQYSLISIAKIIEYCKKKNINNEEFKKSLISFINNNFIERTYLLKENISEAKKSLIEQLNISINFSDELCMKIFVNKLLQYIKLEKYKLELIKNIFEYPQLVKYSSLFFNYIFLFISINPKIPKKPVAEKDKETYLNAFGDIKTKKKDKILIEINKEDEHNEILKEILIYIFELRIVSYFEDCQNTKFIKDNPVLLLTGINYEYYFNTFTNINSNNFGDLSHLGEIFYYAYLRCYLYFVVKLQLENKNLDIDRIHRNLIDINNSPLGKMIMLYIVKLFILNGKKEYFFSNKYLEDNEDNNWKRIITAKYDKPEFFPISKYENSKNLLFIIYSKLHNDEFNEEFLNSLEIIDLYYIINFAYNEINHKMTEDNIEQSTLLLKINELKDNFKIGVGINDKLKKLFGKISDIEFLKEEQIKSNLELIFNMIRLYIIGFIGYKNNNLMSLIQSDNVINLIKILYHNELNNKLLYFESYYKMKKYLEEEYVDKQNYYPVYICSCGRWYTIKDSLPVEIKDCACGLKIGGKNEKLEERPNHFAIYYDEKQKNFIESGRGSKLSNKCYIKGKLLKDFKKEFIIEPILNNTKKLNLLLLENNEITDITFPKIFMNFIFLSYVYIENKIGIIEDNEKNEELNEIDLLTKLINLNKKIEDYLKNTHNITYYQFMNYFTNSYLDLLNDFDCLKEKNKLDTFFKDIIKKAEYDQYFSNIEINMLTPLTYDPQFQNANLKYLSTAAQYPNLDELKKSMASYTKKPLSILKTFVENEKNDDNMSKLSHIEIINDFINTFAEETSNLITRKTYEDETIGRYLDDIRNKNRGETSLIETQFEEFCKSYEIIRVDFPLQITREQPVKNILNDDKIKGKETPINKLYCHLTDIQNDFLQKIIDNYDKNRNELKEDIIINNSIKQIKREIPIQLATKNEIFSFNFSSKIIKTFEELYSFYSLKNIFNDKNNIIDYSKYSEIKFKLNMIEKDLVNIILTGKKLFSKKQITYKFYLDPYEVEEKTKQFEKFTELYDRENLNDQEKLDLLKSTEEDLKKIFLQNLEIIIFYLIKENKYQGKQKISEIKFHSNLYLNKKFIELFKTSNFTINKLISIYEFMEEERWEFIQDRYVSEEFKKRGFSITYKKQLDEFYNDEQNRELKNEMIASLLIKFICRYLPNESKDNENRDLFEIIKEKNINLSEKIQKELQDLKNKFGAKLCDIIDLTQYIVQKNKISKRKPEEKKPEPVGKVDENKPNPDDNPEPEPKEEEEIEDESEGEGGGRFD